MSLAAPAARRGRPRGLLVDLDDTVLAYTAPAAPVWRRICADHAAALGLDPEALFEAIDTARAEYWADEERFRMGRKDLGLARRTITGIALAHCGVRDDTVRDTMSDRFNQERADAMYAFEGAVEALTAMRDAGIKLAMMTNGERSRQREKITRFGLAPLFSVILIEGELGFGKPDPRVYRRALAELDLPPSAVWAVGDNLAWDVGGPQREGMHGVWLDWEGVGLPADSPVQPDQVVASLWELAQRILG